MRRYSLGTGRALTRPRRWNSTTSAQNSLGSVLEDLEEPVDGTPTTVPREGGPLERPYTPNLDLIASASTPGGLASRLARETLLRAGVHPSSLAQPSAAQPSTAQQPSAAQPSAAQPSAAQPSAAQPSAAQPFNFPPFTAQPFTAQPSSTARPETEQESADRKAAQRQILEARRAERIARERGAQQPRQTPRPPGPAPAPFLDPDAANARRRELLLARRAERLIRQETAPQVPQASGSRGGGPAFQGRGGLQNGRGGLQSGRGGLQSGRGGLQSGRGGLHAGRGGVGMRGNTRGRGTRGRGRGGSREGKGGQEDMPPELLEWLEDDDDLPVAATLTAELHSGVDRVFRPKTESKSDARTLRETVAGDYSHFVPQNPQHFIAAAHRIGPVKHSSVTLAHTRHVLAGTQDVVKDVVESSARVS